MGCTSSTETVHPDPARSPDQSYFIKKSDGNEYREHDSDGDPVPECVSHTGSVDDEPHGVIVALRVKGRVLSARFQHGITAEVEQFKASPLSENSFEVSRDRVSHWMSFDDGPAKDQNASVSFVLSEDGGNDSFEHPSFVESPGDAAADGDSDSTGSPTRRLRAKLSAQILFKHNLMSPDRVESRRV